MMGHKRCREQYEKLSAEKRRLEEQFNALETPQERWGFQMRTGWRVGQLAALLFRLEKILKLGVYAQERTI